MLAVSSCYMPETHFVMQTRGGRGFADMFIAEPECIVLEATRDGKDLGSNLNRFLDPQKYEPLLRVGGVKQHAVVDFRSPSSAKPQLQNQHLYNVVFGPDFTEAVINHVGEQQSVKIAGRADDATLQAFAAAVP